MRQKKIKQFKNIYLHIYIYIFFFLLPLRNAPFRVPHISVGFEFSAHCPIDILFSMCQLRVRIIFQVQVQIAGKFTDPGIKIRPILKHIV